MTRTTLIFLLTVGALTTSCQSEPVEESQPVAVADEALRWSESDSPSLMSNDLVYTLADLPSVGEVTRIPWPGSYWPTFQDSINYRWAGADVPSAVEKYGSAFNLANLEDRVSAYSGILSQSQRAACNADGDCTAGEACAKRREAEQGVCIPTWFGLCHAWSPAAIMEPEPIMAVAKSGVTFQVNDLKALLTLAYDRVSTRFVSLRCNESEAQGEIEYDRYGRPTGSDTECLDTNPGTFHVLMANYLGIRKQAFVEDRIFDQQVWNQPLRGYQVLEQREVTAREANTLVGVTSGAGTEIVKSGYVVSSTWAHIGNYPVQAGQHVAVTMTGTGDADLYVRYGAPPTTTGYVCRPYQSNSNEICELDVPAGATQLYVSVRGYALFSRFNLNISLGDGALDVYQFNPDATKFYYVRTYLDYIYESGSNEDGNLSQRIDDYTGIDDYEYLLEIDRNDRIIGGEWLNQSKTSHPDFVWLPVERTPDSSMPVDYTKLKSLLDESVGVNPSGTFVTLRESGTLVTNQWTTFGPFEVAGGSVRAVMTGTNDADLYVRRGAPPTESDFDCRPYIDGSGENCEVAGRGPVYVSVAGYAPSSDFALEITYLRANSP